MKHLPETGTVIKHSRAYYVTIPKVIYEKMHLRKGDRVRVVYDEFYKQMIVSVEGKDDGRVPFKH